MPHINEKNFGRFCFRTEAMPEENLTSEIFCSTNFLLSENFFPYLKIITYYFDSLDPNRVVLIIVENVFLFMQISGMHIVLFQLLDSSSLLVSSDVQRLLVL